MVAVRDWEPGEEFYTAIAKLNDEGRLCEIYDCESEVDAFLDRAKQLGIGNEGRDDMKCYCCGAYAIPQEPLADLIWPEELKGRLPWLVAGSEWTDLLGGLRMTRSVALVLFLPTAFWQLL